MLDIAGHALGALSGVTFLLSEGSESCYQRKGKTMNVYYSEIRKELHTILDLEPSIFSLIP